MWDGVTESNTHEIHYKSLATTLVAITKLNLHTEARMLTIVNAELKKRDFTTLFTAIKDSCTKLTVLRWDWCEIDDIDFSCFTQLPGLTTLRFFNTRCGRQRNIGYLLANSRIAYLGFDAVTLYNDTIPEIAQVLRDNTTYLRGLILNQVTLERPGFLRLMKALETNRTLTRVSLLSMLDPCFFPALFVTLLKNPTLIKLELSDIIHVIVSQTDIAKVIVPILSGNLTLTHFSNNNNDKNWIPESTEKLRMYNNAWRNITFTSLLLTKPDH